MITWMCCNIKVRYMYMVFCHNLISHWHKRLIKNVRFLGQFGHFPCTVVTLCDKVTVAHTVAVAL